jgi:hypothetical protein
MTKRQWANRLKIDYDLIVGERTLEQMHRELNRTTQRTLRIAGRSATTGRKMTVTIPLRAGRVL